MKNAALPKSFSDSFEHYARHQLVDAKVLSFLVAKSDAAGVQNKLSTKVVQAFLGKAVQARTLARIVGSIIEGATVTHSMPADLIHWTLPANFKNIERSVMVDLDVVSALQSIEALRLYILLCEQEQKRGQPFVAIFRWPNFINRVASPDMSMPARVEYNMREMYSGPSFYGKLKPRPRKNWGNHQRPDNFNARTLPQAMSAVLAAGGFETITHSREKRETTTCDILSEIHFHCVRPVPPKRRGNYKRKLPAPEPVVVMPEPEPAVVVRETLPPGMDLYDWVLR